MRRRRWNVVAVALLAACSTVGNSACLSIEESWPGNIGSVGYPLQHDWGPAIAMPGWSGHPHSCIDRSSTSTARHSMCRVVKGIEERGDWRNWRVVATDGEMVAAQTHPTYGTVLVAEESADQVHAFEGCKARSYTEFECDYKILAIGTVDHGSSAIGFFFRKFKDWSLNMGNTAGCAGAITSIWYGWSIKSAGLIACAEGPL